ncbi:L-fucose:H+ symporter permease [Seonamhaeicola marinus]|uniref:L-fucose:H+ symporter permease n=1 Tax=Seonamhaeicola marinus TaxID=1912246 RepID=A0A5D0HUU1_9FLAO|nr:L-fucose:H+ symporter permease [Seonamhaeicola marinus]TYA74681.1 L-fucose:H+ symporter permease [Seonamhaeicola marinus]
MSAKNKIPVIPSNLIVPFILITFCFALWGFANDITNPLVSAFGRIFNQSQTISSFTQVAFYGGYCLMAIPAALFIKKYTYKSGILLGLALYAIGGLIFIPAASTGLFWPFLAAFFILTCGLSFLETSANPYILSMGDESTSTQRLNFAQAFNPIGSITGAWVAKDFILAKMNKLSTEERAALPTEEFEAIKMADLEVVKTPYVIIGIVIAIMFVLILLKKMPKNKEADNGKGLDIKGTLDRLLSNIRYKEGVIAQAFYVGAQICVWTYTIQYGTKVFMDAGMIEADAATEAGSYTIYALIIFAISRFICTFLLKYLTPGSLLMYLAIGGIVLCIPVVFVGGMVGLYSLVAISACMSLMFPTIYGIALRGVGDDAKLGAAGLVMAIGGGALLPYVQAYIIDTVNVNMSYLLPLVCFVFIALYGFRSYKKYPFKEAV